MLGILLSVLSSAPAKVACGVLNVVLDVVLGPEDFAQPNRCGCPDCRAEGNGSLA